MKDGREDPEAPAEEAGAPEGTESSGSFVTVRVPEAVYEDWCYYIGESRRTEQYRTKQERLRPSVERSLASSQVTRIRQRYYAELSVRTVSIITGIAAVFVSALPEVLPKFGLGDAGIIVIAVVLTIVAVLYFEVLYFEPRGSSRRSERRIRAASLAHRAWHNTLASHRVEADDG